MRVRDKIATLFFWLAAGSVAALALVSGLYDLVSAVLHDSPWDESYLWIGLAVVFGAVVLFLGVRQCYRTLKDAA